MARMKLADSIDAKIAKAQDTVVRVKGRYDSALAALEDLMAKKDELLRKELLEAFVKSGKSYAETMKFLKEG
jgi:thioredoxin-like negative regulator of GroEL